MLAVPVESRRRDALVRYRLGPYEIAGQIGVGRHGRGVSRHGHHAPARSVAIKVLPESVLRPTPSVWRVSSVKSKTLASLNHPNIALRSTGSRKAGGVRGARHGARRRSDARRSHRRCVRSRLRRHW